MDAVEINASDSSRNEEGIATSVEICRVCLLGNVAMRELFIESEVASLSAKAMSFANVKMLPGDGLPTRVCCICADKLESAYEFKLQVEQADTVLREKFVSMNMKEELFFDEVEVHLEASERSEDIGEIQMETPYENAAESAGSMSGEEKSSLLKDRLDLLRVEKLGEQADVAEEQNGDASMEPATEPAGDPAMDQSISAASDQASEDRPNPEEESVESMAVDSKSGDAVKHENEGNDCLEGIPSVEHDYILPRECILSGEDGEQGEKYRRDECAEYASNGDAEEEEEEEGEGEGEGEAEAEVEKFDSTNAVTGAERRSQARNETRRSKRKLVRRNFDAERNSDEENYFENLNLSSRLRTSEGSEKAGKICFLCYLCDKEFLSKSVLKEHMHSHEEVRKTLSLKKSYALASAPPSGKRSNKCPYCGKQYTYVIPFSKHLKKHEREQKEGKEEAMPLEISFHEDEHSLDLEDYEEERRRRRRRRHSSTEYRGRGPKRTGEAGGKVKAETEDGTEEAEMEAESAEELEERGRSSADKTRESEDEQDERVSMGAKLFACEKCEESFCTKRALRRHAISHTSLKCNVCEEEFDSLEKLRNHRAKHVVDGVLTGQDLETSTDCRETETENENENEIENENEATRNFQPEYCRGEEGNCRVESGEPTAGSKLDIEGEETAKSTDRNVGPDRPSEDDYDRPALAEQLSETDPLQRHADQQPERKAYKCTECGKTFGNELTLRNHLIATSHKTFVHGQEYDPNKRIKRVAARAAQRIIDKIKTEDGLEDYDEEEEESRDRAARGSSIDGNYVRNKRDGSPQKKHGQKKEQECASCHKKCSSKQSLAKHMEQHERTEQQRASKSEKPKQTGERKERGGQRPGPNPDEIEKLENKEDDYDSDFESGLDWPMDNHECAKCKKRYSTKKSLLRHQLLHEEPNFECDICNVKFYRKDKLKAHYDKCSEKNPDQVRKCNICGDAFENNEILREHRSKHVTEGILTEEDLRDIEPRPEEKKPGEKIGRKRRTDIVGLECTECNKRYTSRKGLLRHIQVHEGKKYLCDICPKKFYRREHLKIHVAKHNMIKPYKCTRCTKRFMKEEQLTNHLSKHDRTFKKNKETDSTKRFLCEICPKSFTQSTTLIAHLRAHYGIKPYVCEVCSRPFTTNAYLKMHMRTHTQERPYVCQYCSRAFARADTLANHLTSHTGEAKYHCKYCPKNFRRLKSLKEHVFIHTGQRPYACPTCDRRFNNNGSRYAHSKRCKQNFVQNQTRPQPVAGQVQPAQNLHRVLQQATLAQGQVVKAQNIKTITITRQPDAVTGQQTVVQHQEILMPLILPLTVTLADVGEEVILPEGTKIFTTS